MRFGKSGKGPGGKTLVCPNLKNSKKEILNQASTFAENIKSVARGGDVSMDPPALPDRRKNLSGAFACTNTPKKEHVTGVMHILASKTGCSKEAFKISQIGKKSNPDLGMSNKDFHETKSKTLRPDHYFRPSPASGKNSSRQMSAAHATPMLQLTKSSGPQVCPSNPRDQDLRAHVSPKTSCPPRTVPTQNFYGGSSSSPRCSAVEPRRIRSNTKIPHCRAS